ncbi:murein biosynthesis integral membrane protein MurJ [Buchnera aphidicola]|uniref:Probable lipid II flippase MurJ n=1 Tax=Buchnera aphidicola (Sarucallis kahawaluokalani) TaxID=1241878 RepID=A0A4D6Y7X5_9GAMM|nr:murein biosynthesis integral membrane protein MurJ [Buchnera aphidicola]QCI26026.1 murein biosynthesis integral membrane protein MurJ [Buchnera aphidicola (Sarucallis kahawaluokalani)]
MNLLKSFINISLVTFFSRILSFIRDFIIAYTFGVSVSTDAFFIAFKVPNLLRRIFAEGAFLQIIIPILIQYKKKNIYFTRKFFSSILGFMILVLFFLTIIGIYCAPYIICIIVPGFLKKKKLFELTVELLRITFPYIFFISLSSLTTAVLNIWNFFVIPVCSPILLNSSMIIFSLFFTKYFYTPIFALSWSVIFGGILQFLYQFLFLKKINMFVLPQINFKILKISNLLKKIGIGILGISANHISLLINSVLSSLFISGSVSWMYYADRLIEFPVGILGISLGTILLSSLTKSIVNNKYNQFCQLINWGIRISVMVGLPSSIILYVLSHPLITVLFQYGKFTKFDTMMTERSLVGYSIGLLGLILVKILSPAFYARQDMKTPMVISLITIIFTQGINLFFLFMKLGNLGLSLSISFSAWLNCILLYWNLHRKGLFKLQSDWPVFLFKVIFSSLVMFIVLITFFVLFPNWNIGTIWWKIFSLLIIFMFSWVIYFLVLFIFGIRLKNFYFII